MALSSSFGADAEESDETKNPDRGILSSSLGSRAIVLHAVGVYHLILILQE